MIVRRITPTTFIAYSFYSIEYVYSMHVEQILWPIHGIGTNRPQSAC